MAASVTRVSPATAWAASGARATASSGGFCVAETTAHAPTATTAPAAPIGVDTLLTLQEMRGDGVRDRAARRHGEAMLRLLAALQRARLSGPTAMAGVLSELGELLEGGPDAADPALRQLLGAIELRVRVELARAG